MQCPFCSTTKTAVDNSRASGDSAIWRRRHCLNCQRIFTTYEKIDVSKLLKVVNGKSEANYAKPRLQISLLKASSHLENGVEDKIDYLCGIIETNALRASEDGKIDLKQFTSIVSETLKLFDKVAFIKYNSSHGLQTDKFLIP